MVNNDRMSGSGSLSPSVRLAQAGDRVLVRLAVTIVQKDERDYYVSHMGERPFRIARARVTALIDDIIAHIELDSWIIARTGKASFLIGYQGRLLYIHEQQVMAVISHDSQSTMSYWDGACFVREVK